MLDYRKILTALGGEAEFADRLLRDFPAMANTVLEDLRLSLESGNANQIRVELHKYRGLMANLHSPQLMHRIDDLGPVPPNPLDRAQWWSRCNELTQSCFSEITKLARRKAT